MREADGGGVRYLREGKGGEEGVPVRDGRMKMVDQRVKSRIEGQGKEDALDRNKRCGKGCMSSHSERTFDGDLRARQGLNVRALTMRSLIRRYLHVVQLRTEQV